MAIASTCVWEIRANATANNVNGGFFRTGASGTDYSQQAAAQYAISFTSAGAGSTIACATASADMVGNGLRTTAGTNVTNTMWFEITSVVVGVSITVSTNAAGTAICTGAAVGGTANVGGALSLNSTLDDDVFEQMIGGNIIYVRGASGVVSLGETIVVASTSSTSTAPISLIGYNSTRGDNPTTISGNQPTIACAANTFTLNQYWMVRFITFTGTGTSILLPGGTYFYVNNCKFTNTSTTAARVGPLLNNSYGLIEKCEAISQNGIAINAAGVNSKVHSCYVHDSATGVQLASNSGVLTNTVINSCATAGVAINTSGLAANLLINNTIRGYSSGTNAGDGVSIAATSPGHKLFNNTISSFATGINKSTTNELSITGSNNNLFDNTTNATNYTLGSTDTTLDPLFVDVTELTGSTASTTGSVLTQSGGDFSTVEDNIDFLIVVSGTGVTVGTYLITSHTATTLTVNNALGTSGASDVVWKVPTGHNLAIGTNLKGIGTPSNYGSETSSYIDVGAVQRAEPTLAATFCG